MVHNTGVIPIPLRPPPTAITTANTAMDDAARPTRPSNNRSSTDPSPSPSLLLPGYLKDKDGLSRSTSGSSSRNRSPYSRSHLRSRSSGAVAAGLPPMTRAHSMPSPYMPKSFPDHSAPASPMRTPARTRSPFLEDGAGIESIQEDSELDFSVSRSAGGLVQPTALRTARVVSGGRRRPASPSANAPFAQPPTSYPADHPASATSAPHSATSSPSLLPQKYNEVFPSSTPSFALHHYSSASSMSSQTSYPSTPTSARSRSPSISSLDTIEDEPEMEMLELLKADAEEEENGGRRGSFESGARPTVGFGFTRGRSERKRWSVCGGERRGDLDLETIWED